MCIYLANGMIVMILLLIMNMLPLILVDEFTVAICTFNITIVMVLCVLFQLHILVFFRIIIHRSIKLAILPFPLRPPSLSSPSTPLNPTAYPQPPHTIRRLPP